jgi:aspartate/methionine/tyrosine aminotransferase
MRLFENIAQPRLHFPSAEAQDAARLGARLGRSDTHFTSPVDDRMLEVYARARDPGNPFELRDLWLGRVAAEMGEAGDDIRLERWRSSKIHREVGPDDVLRSAATVRFIKELFNWFFRDDLYGRLRPAADVILSGGSVDESCWGLPEALKACLRFALDKDWYGYSDSRGRLPARAAIAQYENERIEGAMYDTGSVSLTLGGTAAVSSLADFLLHGRLIRSGDAICAVPNYPPLVQAVGRHSNVLLVPLASRGGRIDLSPLIQAIERDTPFVLLQTVCNPTGAIVDESELAELICCAGRNTTIVLDECHEWLGPFRKVSRARAAPNVIRVSSLSKTWSVPGMKIGWILADPALIAEYYEYASTSIGGPPSFYYTLVEVLARMERWAINDIHDLGISNVGEFETSYGIDLSLLQAAYDSYRLQRLDREATLRVHRDATIAMFDGLNATVVPPAYSINLAVNFMDWPDSYRCFRELLRDTGVSLLPGIITYCFSGAVLRVTYAQKWKALSTAGGRIQDYLHTLAVNRGAVAERSA